MADNSGFTTFFVNTFEALTNVRYFMIFYIVVFIAVIFVFLLNISLCAVDIAFVGGGYGLSVATLFFNLLAFVIFVIGSGFFFDHFAKSGKSISG